MTGGRKKLHEPEPSKRIYEEVPHDRVKDNRNHVVLYDHGKKKTVDSEVLELAKKAAKWDFVTQHVPGFTEEMLVVADLMYMVEFHLTKRLNTFLEDEGLGQIDHVMQAVNRLKIKDKFFHHKSEKKTWKVALQKFFTSLGGNQTSVELLMSQWSTCREWQCRRVSFAHPLDQVGSLKDVKSKILSDEGFAAVREIALIMVDVAMEIEA